MYCGWLVGGEGFAVDASLIAADANKQRSIPGSEWQKTADPETASRAVREYLATLDDAAFGAASDATPKFVSPSDPAAQWTGAMRGPAFFAYAANYLIDVKFGVIVDVEASRAIRQAEVGAAKTMIDRTEERFGLKPERLAADTAYGSAAMLNWVVNEKKITPHIPVIDKSKREDGSLSRQDFTFDKDRNVYVCPQGKLLHTTGRIHDGETVLYRARTSDCGPCPLKSKCCPKAPQRKIPRSIYEDARDTARALGGTEAFEQSRHDRKRVEMLFAHLKRILGLNRLRLRGPCGAQDEFTLAAIAQNLRRLAKLVLRPPLAVSLIDVDQPLFPANQRRLWAMGIRDRPISAQSPWQNGYAERLIGSIRRECLDHVAVFGKQHLRHLLSSYQRYYNEAAQQREVLVQLVEFGVGQFGGRTQTLDPHFTRAQARDDFEIGHRMVGARVFDNAITVLLKITAKHRERSF